MFYCLIVRPYWLWSVFCFYYFHEMGFEPKIGICLRKVGSKMAELNRTYTLELDVAVIPKLKAEVWLEFPPERRQSKFGEKIGDD